MTSREHLVLEPRADKTGKITKRWVKPQSGNSSAGTLPAPSVTAASDTTKRVEKMEYISDTLIGGGSYTNSDDALWEQLKTMSDETIDVLREACEKDEDAESIGKWVAFYGHRQSYLCEILAFHGAFDKNTDPDFMEAVIGKLSSYKELPAMDDYSKADPELKSFIYELCAITDTLYSEDYDDVPFLTPRVIKDPNLVKLLFENPEKAQHVHQVILERDTTDVEAIREVVLSDVVSLSQGIL